MSTTAYRIAIPARHASVRLPGKPLLDVAGKPLIQRTWECARRSGANEVVVATDDRRIADCVEAFGGRVVLTASDHPSGTDRIAECARLCGWSDHDLVVNLQGDEPEMPPECLDAVAQALASDPECAMATLAMPIDSAARYHDPNVVKLVSDDAGRALYFSRAPIPWARDALAQHPGGLPEGTPLRRHVGVYAYRAPLLQELGALPPSPAERAESLEQLRVLHHGHRIRVVDAPRPIPPGIDTPEDLERVREAFSRPGASSP